MAVTRSTLPRLGLGCAPFGNMFRERADGEVAETLEAAWAAGIRYFDTAPHYGLGLSEERLGTFLATKPREEFVVSTKVGRLLRDDPGWDGTSLDEGGFAVPASRRRVLDFSPSGLRASLEESLTRLGLDRVDVLYVHDPEVVGRDGARRALEVLARFRAEGMVDAIGTGSMDVDALFSAAESGLADVLMMANRYTLLDQTALPQVVEACAEHDVDIVAAAVFNSGLLATTPTARTPFNYQAVPDDVLRRALDINARCEAHGVELATAALRYPLLDPRVTTVVAGADHPEHVRQNVDRLNSHVPAALWEDLFERGLVPRYQAHADS